MHRRYSIAAALTATFFVPVAGSTNHTVEVGAGGMRLFDPTNITAEVGDFVIFEFVAGNHTVTQSTFSAPCVQMLNATTNAVGFDSGFMPVQANALEVPAWTVQVNTPNPLWIFCRQTGHCQAGMVMAINAPPTKPYSAFLANAEGQTAGSSPSSAMQHLPRIALLFGALLIGVMCLA